MKTGKPHTLMNEGPEAFERFLQAIKAVLKVPKSAMPPIPFAKREVARNGNPSSRQAKAR